ncbi:hypothetical protein [Pedobacter gandavensis]|uniref:hypothetical protein n=1 Tax=Pedobacter gandavensis TaxID=2679963 RepID=UPI00292D869D|nr:hypothetical protein [Pedobacter gandavensis]
MQIEVREPGTGILLRLEAKSENYQGKHGMRIRYPNGANFFIMADSGAWRSADHHHVAPRFLINIGLALEGRAVSEQLVDQPNT